MYEDRLKELQRKMVRRKYEARQRDGQPYPVLDMEPELAASTGVAGSMPGESVLREPLPEPQPTALERERAERQRQFDKQIARWSSQMADPYAHRTGDAPDSPGMRRVTEIRSGYVHGMTAGLSRGTSKEEVAAQPEFAQYDEEPTWLYDASEFAGAAMPIGKITQGVGWAARGIGSVATKYGIRATRLIGIFSRMPAILQKSLKVAAEAGVAGPIYETLVKKGDITPEEALTASAIWASMGGVMSAGVQIFGKYMSNRAARIVEKKLDKESKLSEVAAEQLTSKGKDQGKRFVNPIGTPEIVLKDRGIVEPFIKAHDEVKAARAILGENLDPVFKDVAVRSKKDIALFKKLDDPNATLEGSALKLRVHFDDLFGMVNRHRVARGQEAIPYRKGYITYLIDYAEEQSKIFQSINIPKKLRFAFEKRTGDVAHNKSARDAVTAYTDAALHDIYYGDALYKAIPNIEKLTVGKTRPIISTQKIVSDKGKKTVKHFFNFGGATFGSERGYAEAYVMRQLGMPDYLERSIHAITRITPRTQKKIAQGVTGAFYKSLIGAALDTGVKNLTQVVHTLGEQGLRPTLRGIGKMLTKKGRQKIRDANLLEEFAPLLAGGEEIKLTGKVAGFAKKFDEYVLSSPMKFSEFVNRGISYHAAIDDFLRTNPSKSIEDAAQYALKQVRKTQFAYGKLHISPYMQSSVTRPLYQFLSFPTKTGEMMWQWAKQGKGRRGKLFRYFATTGALVMGGKYAGVDLSGVFIDPLRMVDPESNEGVRLWPSDKRVSFSLEKGLESGPIPQGPAPIISAPRKIAEKAMREGTTKGDIAKEATRLFVPGGRYGAKVYDVVQELGGEPIRGSRNRTIAKPTTTDSIMKLAGVRPTRIEEQQSKRQRIKEIEDEYYETRTKVIDLKIEGEGGKATELLQEFYEKYPYLREYMQENLKRKDIRAERKKKGMTAKERFMDKRIRKTIDANY